VIVNLLDEIINELSNTAVTLKNLGEMANMPTLEVDIKTTAATLRILLGNDVHFQISPPQIDYYSGKSVNVGPWVIYIGVIKNVRNSGELYEGGTLSEALNKVRAAIVPPEDKVSSIQRELDLASAEPLPL
jgi:hypothetical protein